MPKEDDKAPAPAEKAVAGPVAAGPAVAPAEAAVDLSSYAALRSLTQRQVEKYQTGKGMVKDADTIPHKDQLKTILKGPFGENWFAAKDALIKNKWPDGGKAAPTQAETMQELMWRLIGLRTVEFNNTLRKVRDADLVGEPRAAGKSANERLTWEYSGSETVTSDVDVNLKGPFTHKVVGLFNSRFKTDNAWALEPGTVYDVNVYGLDFMHGFDVVTPEGTKLGKDDKAKVGTIVPQKEGPLADEGLKAQDTDDQEIWALVHLRRYMTATEWGAYKTSQQEGPGGKTANMRHKLMIAEARFDAFDANIHAVVETMKDESTKAEAGLTDVAAAARAHQAVVGEHRAEDAIKMAAANRLYEDKLMGIGALREHLQALLERKKGGAVGLDKEIEMTMLSLRSRISESLVYANEAYTTDGGVNHVVVGMQIGAGQKKKREMDTIHVGLTDPEMLHSFHEQVGDVLKDFGHYEDNLGAAAFKGGKYIHRMIVASNRLGGAGATDYAALKTLGELAVSLKDGGGSSDAQEAKCRELCLTLGFRSVPALRAAVMRMGSQVPVLFRNANEPEVAAELPGAVPVDAPAPADPKAQAASRRELDNALNSAWRKVNAVIAKTRTPPPKKGD
ncbi:MAG: hypothetical protein JWO36_3511 [Myxococcales bacterium]|nr:hypothetical protein [Myxococcales bacterium]